MGGQLKRAIGVAMAAALLSFGADAAACGVCIEDNVAVTYDHAVVKRAKARRHVVVFAAIAGKADPHALARDVKAAAVRAPGVDRDSVRAAPAPSAVSFALDPAITTPGAAIAAIERAAAAARVKLSLLRVVD